MKPNVFIIGDSHTEIWPFSKTRNLADEYFNITGWIYAPSKTAQGLAKKENFKLFSSRVIAHNEKIDYLGIHLGEVDCGYTIWSRMLRENTTKEEEINFAINNVEGLAIYLKKHVGNIILMSPIIPLIESYEEGGYKAVKTASPVPGRIKRREVKWSHKERTDLVLLFEESLNLVANRNNFMTASINNKLLDPKTSVVKKEYMNLGAGWHLPKRISSQLWIEEIATTIEKDKNNAI